MLHIFLINFLNISVGVWAAVLIGSIGGIIVGLVTEYYTGGPPVRKIAKDGETGSATIMITGLVYWNAVCCNTSFYNSLL